MLAKLKFVYENRERFIPIIKDYVFGPPKKRQSAPTILQMEAVECGAAALAIVMAHHGRWIPLEQLRVDCGVSRDGSKASNVLKAARAHGLKANGYKRKPEQLREMVMPAILHWNFNHFLVLEGFGSRGRVYLNDPASGPRQVTYQELFGSFTGVVLTFKKDPEKWEPFGSKPSLLPALKRRLAGSSIGMLFVVLISFCLVAPGLVTPIFPKVFIDSILLDLRYEWIQPLLLAMGLTAIGLTGLTWMQQSALLRLENKIALAGSARFFWHVLRLPIAFFTQRFSGDIASRVAINDRVAQLLSRDLATHSLNAVMIAFFATVMFTYDVFLTLLCILFSSANALALRFVSRKRIDGNMRMQQDVAKMAGTAANGLRMIETLKASGAESDFFSRWSGYQAKVVNGRQELERYSQVLTAVPPLLSQLQTALILGLGSLKVINGGMTIGGLLAFQVLSSRFSAPINELVNLGGKLQAMQADMNRLDDVLRYEADEGIVPEAEAPPEDIPVKLNGRLELKDITFGYSRMSPPLIKGFSLTLEPGQRIALVGGSGSGKSTVARLISGLHKPWTGEILFDGQERDAIPRSVLNNSLAIVDQSIMMFEGTIRENITIWDETKPMKEIIAASRDASIHEEIASRPLGYEATVKERGANFSGGQRQRLEIARALVSNPTVMILDEATSALDPTTEAEIDHNLRRRGCTCLIVAHRLSTVRDADEIIVLDKGEVVQRGTHEEMIAEEGPYANLVSDH
ncbi:MAG: NHLP family bacteriocin export ABC transporter peptidase/permease/ATPase subunit [Acidobacteriota bacterium]